jgi:dTDP-4-dehydrorhamnose reductase
VSPNQGQRCRWLVTGSGGMLGRDLAAAVEEAGDEVVGRTRRQLDITDEAAVLAALHDCRPDVVVNCAAWTAVDDAEAHENEALGVNGNGAAHLAAACAAGRARLVHLSTDYVFGGDASRPYAEHDAVAPRTAYGRTKLAGEQAVLRLLPRSGYVVRTAWLYGAHGPNFVSTMIRLERERPTVAVVTDQRGQPTWTADVAGQIIALVRSPRAAGGIYHATSSGEATWFELAREVFRLLGADPARVQATASSAYPRPAPRPGYSVLGHDGWASAGIEPIGDWRLALRRAWPGLLPPDHPRSRTPPVQVGLTRYGR